MWIRIAKTFILFAVVVSAVMLATACGGDDGETAGPTPTGAPAGDAAAGSSPQPTASSAADCGLTVGTTEGPYYITSTPELTDGDLNYTGLPGDPIRVNGHVYGGEDTSSPVAGARIEIWQTDGGGAYHPAANGDMSQYAAADIALRGYVVSDQGGAYTFTSIYPGYYPGRTRHIHVRASAGGFGGVVTQIIVPAKAGDGTTPETDDIAQSLPSCNFVTFTEQGGIPTATFDFHLGAD
jgi:protocatechuate 3,4-dioxygenase beta subunit